MIKAVTDIRHTSPASVYAKIEIECYACGARCVMQAHDLTVEFMRFTTDGLRASAKERAKLHPWWTGAEHVCRACRELGK